MSSFNQVLLQIVFGHKYSRSFLDLENQDFLFNYIAGMCRKRQFIPFAVGGYSNHIHIVVKYHQSTALADFVKVIKTSSNTFMKERNELFPKFKQWQIGYGAFSYSFDAKDGLVRYVKNQYNHHHKKTYREEYIEYLKRFSIDYDERYLDI